MAVMMGRLLKRALTGPGSTACHAGDLRISVLAASWLLILHLT
jgi:hypothetical protein